MGLSEAKLGNSVRRSLMAKTVGKFGESVRLGVRRRGVDEKTGSSLRDPIGVEFAVKEPARVSLLLLSSRLTRTELFPAVFARTPDRSSCFGLTWTTDWYRGPKASFCEVINEKSRAVRNGKGRVLRRLEALRGMSDDFSGEG